MEGKKTNNLFNLDPIQSSGQEVFESILKTRDLTIERIVTSKPYDNPGDWYDQENDEWVLLIQGEASLEFSNNEVITLIPGDYILIPAHKKHRVKRSSEEPKCIWLAIHGKLK
ncbi:MAG: cupin domain-containing protein [Bacteroidales bacterium]